MAKSASKPPITKRFFAWLLSIVVGFIVRRIMKRLGAAQEAPKSGKQGRKYVKNKAD